MKKAMNYAVGVVAGLALTAQTAQAQVAGFDDEVASKSAKGCVNGVHTVKMDASKVNGTGILLPVGASFEFKSEKHGTMVYGASAGDVNPMTGMKGTDNLLFSGWSLDQNVGHAATLVETHSADGSLTRRAALSGLMNEKKTITKNPGELFLRANDTKLGDNSGIQTLTVEITGCPTNTQQPAKVSGSKPGTF